VRLQRVQPVLRLDFDRRLLLQFRGSFITSVAGLLAFRELDDALGLSTLAGDVLADARIGRNGRHALFGWLRQSVFGRLAASASACQKTKTTTNCGPGAAFIWGMSVQCEESA
jgi:hypothetical protein